MASWRICDSMAPEVAQRSWISGEANHGGSCHAMLQRLHRGAGLMGKQIMEDMRFNGSRGSTEEQD